MGCQLQGKGLAEWQKQLSLHVFEQTKHKRPAVAGLVSVRRWW